MVTQEIRCAGAAPLEGKTVLIAGKANSDSCRIVLDLVAQGARVVLPTALRERVEALIGHGTVSTGWQLCDLDIDAATAVDAHALQRGIASRFGQLDAIVVDFGAQDRCLRLLDSSIEECEKVIVEDYAAHLLMARALVPLLRQRRDSLYIFVGRSWESAPSNGSLVAAPAAAQLMLAQSLAVELQHNPRVLSLLISSAQGVSGTEAITSENIGEAVATLVADPMAGHGEVVFGPGWRARLGKPLAEQDVVSFL